MSKAYEFLKECGAFFVLSINGDYPAGRPFGAVMEVGDDLYLSCLLYTSDAADDSLRVDLGGRRIIKKNFFKQKTAY